MEKLISSGPSNTCTGVPLPSIKNDQLHRWNIHLSICTAASFSKTKGAVSRWIWICWLPDLRHNDVVFQEKWTWQRLLTHTHLFVRGLPNSEQRSVQHCQLSQRLRLFVSGGTLRLFTLRQLSPCSAPVPQAGQESCQEEHLGPRSSPPLVDASCLHCLQRWAWFPPGRVTG